MGRARAALSRFRAAPPGLGAVALSLGILILTLSPSAGDPVRWMKEFPATDFSKHGVPFEDIRTDGARRDSITPITAPTFKRADKIRDIGPLEPVLSVEIEGETRAYPLRILLWHEIVNDTIGGIPILVSYCPLCASGVVFDRRLDGTTLAFGNAGRLRHFDMIMYDHNTESWWQQFLGEAIVGALTGKKLKPLPSRIESFELFRGAAPNAKVLVPAHAKARAYGTTPYVRMDSRRDKRSSFPFDIPDGVLPLERAVIVGDEAWLLERLKEKRRIEKGDLVLSWSPGQNSIHDARWIHFGRDIGNVTVQRKTNQGLEDAVYDVTFAFAFAAFRPGGTWHLGDGEAIPKQEDSEN